MFIHPQYDFLAANVDGIIQPNEKHSGCGILEIKTTLRSRISFLSGWSDVPVEYQHQIMHYLGVTGFEYAYLQVYHRDDCTYSKPLLILPDRDQIEQTNQRLAEWWTTYIKGDTPPPLTSQDDLKLKYPTAEDGKTVQATDDIIRKFHALKQVRERIGQMEDLKESFEMDIKGFMGDGERPELL